MSLAISTIKNQSDIIFLRIDDTVYVESESFHDLRSVEKVETVLHGVINTKAVFNIAYYSRQNALYGIYMTLFVLFLLVVSTGGNVLH